MSQSAQAYLKSAFAALHEAGVADPVTDARRLMAHALELPAERLTLVINELVSPEAAQRFLGFVEARAQRQPVSQIVGLRAFWGREFQVAPEVLDPRPETEVLIEVALADAFDNVLDLGVGSGCILLSLLAERPHARGMGIDASTEALKIAGLNARALGLGARADLRLSDWLSGVQGLFDLIVSNPPYISLAEMGTLAPEVRLWEPMAALTPGPEGLESYGMIAAGIDRHLSPGGRVVLEIGPTQARAVEDIFTSVGLDLTGVHKDLDGRDRVVALRKPL